MSQYTRHPVLYPRICTSYIPCIPNHLFINNNIYPFFLVTHSMLGFTVYFLNHWHMQTWITKIFTLTIQSSGQKKSGPQSSYEKFRQWMSGTLCPRHYTGAQRSQPQALPGKLARSFLFKGMQSKHLADRVTPCISLLGLP